MTRLSSFDSVARPVAQLQEEFKRDFYLTAAEAAAYGLIDHVLVPKQVPAQAPAPLHTPHLPTFGAC